MTVLCKQSMIVLTAVSGLTHSQGWLVTNHR